MFARRALNLATATGRHAIGRTGVSVVPKLREIVNQPKHRFGPTQEMLQKSLRDLQQMEKEGKAADAAALVSTFQAEFLGAERHVQNEFHAEIAQFLRPHPGLWLSQGGRLWASSNHYSAIQKDTDEPEM